MSEGRAAITRAIETIGIVAVIRVKDPSKVRAVVDALTEGGVRALEVTMTVPRAVDLIRELAPTMPTGFLLGAGTVTDVAPRMRCRCGLEVLSRTVFRPDVTALSRRYVPDARCFAYFFFLGDEIFAAHYCGATS